MNEQTTETQTEILAAEPVAEIRKNFPGYGGLTREALGLLGTKELVDLFNGTEPPKKVKVFTKKSDGADAVWCAFPDWDGTNEHPSNNQESESDMAKKSDKKATKEKAAKTPKPAKAPKASKPRGGAFPEGAKIKILVDGNPKREGSSSHKRFAVYKQNMLVATALENGVKTADVHWDVKHNYITIV